jgi:hypothetical protein
MPRRHRLSRPCLNVHFWLVYGPSTETEPSLYFCDRRGDGPDATIAARPRWSTIADGVTDRWQVLSLNRFIRASHPGFEFCRYIVPLVEVGRPRQRKTAASARSATTLIALRRGWRYPASTYSSSETNRLKNA